MDFMNCLMMGMAAAWREFDRPEHPFGRYLKDYYEHIREHDLALTHTLVTPQVDRSKPVEEQTKDVAARIVKETDAGFIIRDFGWLLNGDCWETTAEIKRPCGSTTSWGIQLRSPG